MLREKLARPQPLARKGIDTLASLSCEDALVLAMQNGNAHA
jgi:hypothetical protein